VAPFDPATLRNRDVERIATKLAESSGGRLKVEKYAESLEGRPIFLMTLGTGPRGVLLWSQMHGDEPTHTSVVLDLFSYLLQQPAKPLTADILSGCTLMFLPMLNPDGAEAVIRYNAQGIDINRDWRRLVTPEARALLRAAKELKPQFGFNLHNQNARTSIGKPPRPAAISVLAPAPDSTRTVPPSMLVAKQMCACFVEAVRPYAEGMISRYDDTHEPRAFGDGIQSLGVSTMLVEAGGWTDADPEPMTRLHFHGMLNTLHAIATDKYKQADHQIYEALPESNSARMSDLSIPKANVLDVKVPEAFIADIVLDQILSERLSPTSSRDGKIIEIGDLPPGSPRTVISGSNSLVVPGQITLVEEFTPKGKLSDGKIEELLSRGTTSVIGVVNLTDRASIEAAAEARELPFNWGFVGQSDGLSSMKPIELLENLALATASGILAVVSTGTDEELWQSVHQFGLPLIKAGQLAAKPGGTYRGLTQNVWATANALKLQARRGRVNRDYAADLLFFEHTADSKAVDAVDWKKLTRVMVGGEVVWENVKRAGGSPGIFLRRT
jgi:hypothetical protein